MDANFLAVVRVALSVITERLLTLSALLMTFGLAVWAMYDPELPRLQISCGFAILVFLPSLFKERLRSHERQAEQERI
jgi:hypothetical protein